MRLTLLNQFYRPDISPTAQLTASLAEHRARRGDRVTVITGHGGYVPVIAPQSNQRRESGSRPNGPDVRRQWTPGLGKHTLPRRLLDYLSFYISATLEILRLPRQDVIVSLTTPPYIAWAAVLHKAIHRGTRVILWSMDCYPDVVERAGMIRRGGLLSRILRAVNRSLFRQIDTLVCLDTAMRDLLMSQYAPRPSHPGAHIIPNWEDAAFFPPLAQPHGWDEAATLGLQNRFVVLYLGNTGVGHGFDTVLEAADRLRDEPIVFLFIGGGSRWPRIEEEKIRRQLANVILRGYVPKEQTPAVMASASAALITLRDEALGVMSPSKLHANLAAGLPILYVGPPRSNVDDAIRRFDCGISVREGDTEGFVAAVRALARDPARHEAMRQRARHAFDAAYCDVRTLPQFDGILDRRGAGMDV